MTNQDSYRRYFGHAREEKLVPDLTSGPDLSKFQYQCPMCHKRRVVLVPVEPIESFFEGVGPGVMYEYIDVHSGDVMGAGHRSHPIVMIIDKSCALRDTVIPREYYLALKKEGLVK